MKAGLVTELKQRAGLTKESQLKDMYGASWTVVDPARDPKQRDIGCVLTEAG